MRFGSIVGKWFLWNRLDAVFGLVRNYYEALNELKLRLKNVTVAIVASSQLIQHLIQVLLQHTFALFGMLYMLSFNCIQFA